MPKVSFTVIAAALMFATACGGSETTTPPPATPQSAARSAAESPETKNSPKIGASDYFCEQMTAFVSGSVTVAANSIGTNVGNQAVLDAATALTEAERVAPTAIAEDLAVVAGAWQTAANRVKTLSGLGQEKDTQTYSDTVSSAQSSIDDVGASNSLVIVGQYSADECGVDPRRSGSAIATTTTTTTMPPTPPTTAPAETKKTSSSSPTKPKITEPAEEEISGDSAFYDENGNPIQD